MRKSICIMPLFMLIIFSACEKQPGNIQPDQVFQNSIIEAENVYSNEEVESEKKDEFFTIEDDDVLPKKEAVSEKKDGFPILFTLNGLYGYLDNELNIITPPIYFNGYNYTEQGYALAYIKEKGDKEDKGRILDREGKTVFEKYTDGIYMLYDDIITFFPVGENYPRIIKAKDNSVIAEVHGFEADLNDDEVIIYVRFTPGIERGYIDSSGNRILPDLVIKRNSRGFKEGRAVIVDENWKTRIIDINGNIYGNLDIYRVGRNFSEGLLPVETSDGITGYINKDGEFAFHVPIVPYEPDHGDESPLCATDFKDGYAIIQTEYDPPIWRVINNQGQFTSEELSISDAYNFVDGLSRVVTNDKKYGYVNTKGEMVIEPIFEEAESFFNGYAIIIHEGRDGLVNTEGKIFWSDEIVNRQKK